MSKNTKWDPKCSDLCQTLNSTNFVYIDQKFPIT